MESPLKWRQPALKDPCLIVTWHEDAAGIGPSVAKFLVKALGGEKVGGIEPLGFFPMSEVEIRNNIIQFPVAEFYACPASNLIILKSFAPRYEWHRYLNVVLDAAQKCGAGELYIVGGMVSLTAHTKRRQIIAITNGPEIKERLSGYGLVTGMDFRTPPGGRPTLSSFLLWTARQRGVSGANIWVETPLYLVGAQDAAAVRVGVEFLRRRLNLSVDLKELEDREQDQENRISAARGANPEIDGCITKLENGEPLDNEEGAALTRAMLELFR